MYMPLLSDDGIYLPLPSLWLGRSDNNLMWWAAQIAQQFILHD